MPAHWVEKNGYTINKYIRYLVRRMEKRGGNQKKMKDIVIGLLIPFVGTTLGASCAFFMKNELMYYK